MVWLRNMQNDEGKAILCKNKSNNICFSYTHTCMHRWQLFHIFGIPKRTQARKDGALLWLSEYAGAEDTKESRENARIVCRLLVCHSLVKRLKP